MIEIMAHHSHSSIGFWSRKLKVFKSNLHFQQMHCAPCSELSFPRIPIAKWQWHAYHKWLRLQKLILHAWQSRLKPSHKVLWLQISLIISLVQKQFRRLKSHFKHHWPMTRYSRYNTKLCYRVWFLGLHFKVDESLSKNTLQSQIYIWEIRNFVDCL